MFVVLFASSPFSFSKRSHQRKSTKTFLSLLQDLLKKLVEAAARLEAGMAGLKEQMTDLKAQVAGMAPGSGARAGNRSGRTYHSCRHCRKNRYCTKGDVFKHERYGTFRPATQGRRCGCYCCQNHLSVPDEQRTLAQGP